LVGTLRGLADTSGLYRVTVTDGSRPVGGVRVDLDFSGAPGVRVGAAQPFGGMSIDAAARYVTAFTNLGGVASFTIVGAARTGACQPGTVAIRVSGSVVRQVPVACVDLDGAGGLSLVDIGTWIGLYYGGSYCALGDYDGDGRLTLSDYARLANCYYSAQSWASAGGWAW
jgi:hypothetical protein